jgi:hypothetical protein
MSNHCDLFLVLDSCMPPSQNERESFVICLPKVKENG